MHSALNSLRKRWYTLRLDNARCAAVWGGRYWSDGEGNVRSIRCRSCPRFSASGPRCSVPFGSPLRRCVTAAQEAHLHSLGGKQVLEIGFGKHSIPRKLVTSAGGTWTGIDPFARRTHVPRLGEAGYGHVGDLPFPDETFDVVAGVQSFEHWDEPLPGIETGAGHARGLAEIHRVLKPGGRLYLDAPIHLHGHEMFVAGDLDRIRGLFDAGRWKDVIVEKWREDHEPLERYPSPEIDQRGWPTSVTSYPAELLHDIAANRSVWLIVITARKNGKGS